jgi:hypothetical protein
MRVKAINTYSDYNPNVSILEQDSHIKKDYTAYIEALNGSKMIISETNFEYLISYSLNIVKFDDSSYLDAWNNTSSDQEKHEILWRRYSDLQTYYNSSVSAVLSDLNLNSNEYNIYISSYTASFVIGINKVSLGEKELNIELFNNILLTLNQ